MFRRNLKKRKLRFFVSSFPGVIRNFDLANINKTIPSIEYSEYHECFFLIFAPIFFNSGNLKLNS